MVDLLSVYVETVNVLSGPAVREPTSTLEPKRSVLTPFTVAAGTATNPYDASSAGVELTFGDKTR
ncbi:MAG: hypothetical protein ACRCWJ_15210 [Casimicrobium sp.]